MDISIHDYLDSLEDKKGDATGGSTTALIGALSASLGSFILDIQKGKDEYADKEEEMKEAEENLRAGRNRMEELIQESQESFKPVKDALAMPKETEEEKKERNKALSEGYEEAVKPQVELMQELGKIVKDLEFIVKLEIDGSLTVDLAISILFTQSTLQAAHLNALQNVKEIKDKEVQRELLGEINQLLTEKTQEASFLFQLVTYYINADEWPDIEATEARARQQLEEQQRQMGQQQGDQ